MTAKPFYYIINYRAYPAGTAGRDLHAGPATKPRPRTEKPARRSDGHRLIANPGAMQSSTKTRAGATVPKSTLPDGPSAVRATHHSAAKSAVARPPSLRSTVLAMTCDGEETVWCPLGDFFCSADSLHPFQTWQRTVTEDGTMTCRWVMPYRKSGRDPRRQPRHSSRGGRAAGGRRAAGTGTSVPCTSTRTGGRTTSCRARRSRTGTSSTSGARASSSATRGRC